jgi:hypothetical protein
VREQNNAFLSAALSVAAEDGVLFDIWYSRSDPKNGFSVLIDKKATGFPSSTVLAPWNACPAARCRALGAGPEREISLGSLASLESQIRECRGLRVFFGHVTAKHFEDACDALLECLAGRVTYASLLMSFEPPTVGELFPVVATRVPAYFDGGFFARYRKGFDPYARPAAADAGETVRYPMVSIERPKLSRDGDKDLQIDLVHRPQGDCYFDIQVVSFNPPNDTVVRKTLEDAIKPLAVKAEIWEGDPFQRWM